MNRFADKVWFIVSMLDTSNKKDKTFCKCILCLTGWVSAPPIHGKTCLTCKLCQRMINIDKISLLNTPLTPTQLPPSYSEVLAEQQSPSSQTTSRTQTTSGAPEMDIETDTTSPSNQLRLSKSEEGGGFFIEEKQSEKRKRENDDLESEEQKSSKKRKKIKLHPTTKPFNRRNLCLSQKGPSCQSGRHKSMIWTGVIK